MNLSVATEPVSTPSLSTRPERYAIDPLRGYVCLGIVAMHAYMGTVHPELQARFGPRVDSILANWRLGVESFFVLAGFFLVHMLRPAEGDYLSVPRFLSRRLLRLAIPYWGAVLIAFGDRALVNMVLGHSNSLPSGLELLAILGFVQDIVSVEPLIYFHWSIATLMQYYLIWVMLYWLVRRALLWRGVPDYSLRTLRFMQLITALALAVTLGVLLSPWPGEWHLPSYVPYLAAGSLLYWVTHGQMSWWVLVMCAVAMVAMGLAVGEMRCLKAVICGVLIIALTRGHALPNVAIVRALSHVGVWSYSIYLLHGWIGFRILNISNHLRDRGLLSDGVAVALVVLAILAGIAVGALYYHLVERPIAVRARQVTYRQ